MSVPRVGHCVFCDDIRHEIGGKTSLIGIYQNDMIFQAQPPVVYPKLCLSVWIISEPDDLPDEVRIFILAPNKTEISKFVMKEALPREQAEGAQKAIISVSTVISPIVFDESGYLEVWVETEREKFRAGRLKISFSAPTKNDPQSAE